MLLLVMISFDHCGWQYSLPSGNSCLIGDVVVIPFTVTHLSWPLRAAPGNYGFVTGVLYILTGKIAQLVQVIVPGPSSLDHNPSSILIHWGPYPNAAIMMNGYFSGWVRFRYNILSGTASIRAGSSGKPRKLTIFSQNGTGFAISAL